MLGQKNFYIIQLACPSAIENLVELLLMVDHEEDFCQKSMSYPFLWLYRIGKLLQKFPIPLLMLPDC